MIQGFFGNNGELYFEIDLIAADGSIVTVDALLDTGFTEWLAMDIQDVDGLGWSYIKKRKMQTARGEVNFKIYQASVSFDGNDLTLPVLAGKEITEVLIGLPWLENKRLVVDRKMGILTLGEE